MGKRRKYDKKHSKVLLLAVIAAIVLFCLGYFFLNYVATWEKPVLGNTFYIVMGCVLIAVSGIIIFIVARKRFFPSKKRKSSSKPVFLRNSTTKIDNNSNA